MYFVNAMHVGQSLKCGKFVEAAGLVTDDSLSRDMSIMRFCILAYM